MDEPAARSIALVGLSGSGKSTVARLLAERLGWPWADTDQLIEQIAGASIPAIFSAQGETAFRNLEAQALRCAFEKTSAPLVLATGGGLVLRRANRALLQEHARVVWLDAPVLQLVARLAQHDEQRPLLAGNAFTRLTTLHTQRAPLYAEVAELRVDTVALTPEQVVGQILIAFHEV